MRSRRCCSTRSSCAPASAHSPQRPRISWIAMASVSVGAVAVILDAEGRVLLCHRRDCDLWNLPGGGMEAGETPWQAVVREVKEEVGLDVVVTRLAGVYSKPDRADLV